jgi:hypothetical protein
VDRGRERDTLRDEAGIEGVRREGLRKENRDIKKEG